MFTDSARAIWLDLKDRFQKRNGPRIFHLKRSMAILKQDQDLVTTYFSKLKGLWDEYVSYRPACTCGHCTCGGSLLVEKFVQFEYLLNFLIGLNDSYGHSRSQILLMDPPPPISTALYLIAQEEEQKVDITTSPISLAVGSTVSRETLFNTVHLLCIDSEETTLFALIVAFKGIL